MKTVVRLRPRWDDCDAHGHVNNAVYLEYIRSATEDGLAALGSPRRLDSARLAEAELTYREPIRSGEEVEIEVAVVDDGADGLACAYEISVGERSCATVTARWVDGASATAASLPQVGRDAGGKPFFMEHRVRSYEVGADGAMRPAVILQLVEHAVYVAAERTGWNRERMRAAEFVTLQVGHRLAMGAPASAGDELLVESRIVEMRRVSGVWHHQVRRKGGPVMAGDLSRGAFLDRHGRLRPAPQEMLTSLLAGEPTGLLAGEPTSEKPRDRSTA